MERGMQFISALLGGTDNSMLNAAFALGIVLVLIVLGVWGLKLLSNAGESLGRGRNRRLAVVESAVVDGKRKVVIIRRDNVEHVIMTGGPADLVIESGVPVVAPEPIARRKRSEPAKPQPKAAAAPAPPPGRAAEVAPVPPATQRHVVPREAIDRLRDLARPAPLKPRDPLRDTRLLRPAPRPDIPTGPQLRVDNSAGRPADSDKTSPVEGSDGQPRFVGRRFFRNAQRREPN
jgi:flagellar protein FliO/FliZ